MRVYLTPLFVSFCLLSVCALPAEEMPTTLDRTIEIDLKNKTVAEALAAISKAAGVEIHIEKYTQENNRIDQDELVWIDAPEISLRSALQLVLSDEFLLSEIGKTVLITHEDENLEYETVVYQADDMKIAEKPLSPHTFAFWQPRDRHDLDETVYLVTNFVNPTTWAEVGGPGTIMAVGSSLAVSHTSETHRNVRSLLTALRTSIRPLELPPPKEEPGNPFSPADGGYRPNPFATNPAYFDFKRARTEAIAVGPPRQVEREEQLKELLHKKRYTVKFDGLPLDEAAAGLAHATSAPFFVDLQAIKDVYGGQIPPVSLDVRDVPLHTALRTMLEPLEFTFTVWNETILISTVEENEVRTSVVVYPVADLVMDQPTDWDIDPDDLIEAITLTASRWLEHHNIEYFRRTRALVVLDNFEGHTKIAKLLKDIRLNQGSPERRQNQMRAWHEELVWQGFQWQESQPAKIQADPFGGGGFQGGFFNMESERVAQFPGRAPKTPAAAADATEKKPPPPEPMSDEQREQLKRMITDAIPSDVKNIAGFVMLSRDHDILVRHKRYVMIEIEKQLIRAPVTTTFPNHWSQRTWTNPLYQHYQGNVPVVGQRD